MLVIDGTKARERERDERLLKGGGGESEKVLVIGPHEGGHGDNDHAKGRLFDLENIDLSLSERSTCLRHSPCFPSSSS